MPSPAGKALIVFSPSGKRGHFPLGTPVLQAARELGVDIDSICGGRARCGRCQVEAVEVLRADEEGFGIPEAVSAAVKQYRFKPGTKNEVEIKTYATVTKRFNFRGR